MVSCERAPLLLSQGGAQVFESAEQIIFLIVEVGVQGGSADVGAIEDVLHGERLEAFFLNQRE